MKSAFALFVQDGEVDAACGRIRRLGKRSVGKALVMPQVEIGFRSVVGDENFTVLVGIHRSRIDVQVRVEFLIDDFVSSAF